MLNPCCCITPRIGVFIFGVIDLILSASWLLLCVRDILETHARSSIYIWIELGLSVFLLFMALLLVIGAYKNAADKIRLWLILWTVYVIVAIVIIVLNVYDGAVRVGPRQGSSFGFVILFIYQIWVVYAYLYELRGAGLTYCPAQLI